MEKQCRLCKKTKNINFFNKAGRGDALRSSCKQCDAKQYKQWKDKNRDKYLNSSTNSALKIKYGIGLEEYQKLLSEQNHCCKICRSKKPGRAGVKRFAVDHCHKTQKIRGLLCMQCNTAIGLLNENPILFDAAKQYLESHSQGTCRAVEEGLV